MDLVVPEAEGNIFVMTIDELFVNKFISVGLYNRKRCCLPLRLLNNKSNPQVPSTSHLSTSTQATLGKNGSQGNNRLKISSEFHSKPILS